MILVTGATGFLGKYIIDELLAADYEVRALVRNPQQRKLPWGSLVDVSEGDILDVVALEKAMDGVAKVVHAAAVVSFWKKRRAELMQVNVKGTANVVNACLDAGIEKLVHVSSIAAIGRTGTKEPATEATKWKNGKDVSWYSRSKYKAELQVYRGIAEGLNAVMINPGGIIGPAEDWQSGTAKIFTIVNRGLSFYNRGTNGLVGARDVALAARLVMEQDVAPGERFLLAAESISQKEICQQISELLGKQAPRWAIPPWISRITGVVSEMMAGVSGKEPIITRESMRNSTRLNYFDGSKITQLGFKYTPMKVVFKETAKAFIESNTH